MYCAVPSGPDRTPRRRGRRDDSNEHTFTSSATSRHAPRRDARRAGPRAVRREADDVRWKAPLTWRPGRVVPDEGVARDRLDGPRNFGDDRGEHGTSILVRADDTYRGRPVSRGAASPLIRRPRTWRRAIRSRGRRQKDVVAHHS